MNARARTAPVVAGIGTDHASAADAVRWAAAEAAATGRPLHIVQATCPATPAVPCDLAIPAANLHEAARTVLDQAVRTARAVASELVVTAGQVPDAVVPTLLAESRTAELVVVGGRRHGRLHTLLRGSTAGSLATGAACPVALVRSSDGLGGGCPPRVVVGIGHARRGDATVRDAFVAAARRGIPLVAVHAWAPDVPADLEAAAGSDRDAEAAAHRVLENALAPWREVFPAVEVVPRVVRGHPAHALLEQSCGAALTVVGGSRRGPLLAAVLGSVTRAVLDRARSPVVVRPAAPVAQDAGPASRMRRRPPSAAR